MMKNEKTQPAATTPAQAYQAQLARIIAAAGDLAAEIELLRQIGRTTGKLAPQGIGPALHLRSAIDKARTGWKIIDPTLVGLPPVDRKAEAIREAEHGLDLTERRLKWAQELPGESVTMTDKRIAVELWTDAVKRAKRRLAWAKGEDVPPDEPTEDDVWNLAQRLGSSMRRAREALGLDPGPERGVIPELPR